MAVEWSNAPKKSPTLPTTPDMAGSENIMSKQLWVLATAMPMLWPGFALFQRSARAINRVVVRHVPHAFFRRIISILAPESPTQCVATLRRPIIKAD
jgi:hypothetical protein